MVGLGSFDFKKKTLFFKNFAVNNYILNGNILEGDSKLTSNLNIFFDKNKFDHSDIYLFKVFTKNLFSENKNLLNFNDQFSFNKLKSQILINSTFDRKSAI